MAAGCHCVDATQLELVSVTSVDHPVAREALTQLQARGDFTLLYTPTQHLTTEQLSQISALVGADMIEHVEADLELSLGRVYILPCCSEHVVHNGRLTLLRFPAQDKATLSPGLNRDTYQRIVRDAAVLLALTDGVIIADQSGTILEMNTAALRLHGCGSLAEARVGNGYAMATGIFHMDGSHADFDELPISRIVRKERFDGLVLKVAPPRSRSLRYLSYTGNSLTHGNVRYAILTIRDITDTETAHQRLLENERLFKAAIDCYPGPFIIYDCDRRVQYVNRTAVESLGLSPEKIIGLRCEEFRPAEWVTNYLSVLEHAYETREVQQIELGYSRGGLQHEVQMIFVPIPDEQGTVVNTLGITHDLTSAHKDRRRIEELNKKLEQKAWQLRKTVSELESFSYAVAHDLLAPLRAMVGFAQVLLEDYAAELDEEGRGFAQRIVEAALRMGRLLDDILKLSRVSVQEFVRAELDLAQIARELLEQHSPDTERITFRIPETIPATGDEGLLRIALHNLLSNAIKYSRHISRPEIHFGAIHAGAVSTYFVRDNGIGFDEAKAKSMFQPFNRFHDDEQFEGNGIGLAIVRRVIERHGGRIWAKSSLGAGAMFLFTLGEG